jgi:hypothetical protein
MSQVSVLVSRPGCRRLHAARRLVHPVLSAALLCGTVTVLTQQPASAHDAPLAETLFNEGRVLMAAKRFPEACAKFTESQRLDAATGTLLNLAACHEAEGKLATAWAEYREAQRASRRSNRSDRIRFTDAHLAELEKHLSYLTVHVPPAARIPGLEVFVDGIAREPAAWETAAPVDPGAHRVTATVPGRTPFVRDVTTTEPGQRLEVEIGFVPSARATKPESLVDTPALSDAAQSPPWWDRRRTTVAIGAAGAALLAAGTVFGLRAFSQWSDRDNQCTDAARACSPGLTSAWIANITLPLGVLGMGAASYRLWRE